MRIRKDKSGLDAVRTPSDFDVAWAAGLYEGEGSCIKSGNSFGVSVAQKDPEVLYRLRDLFGGTVKDYPNDRGTNKNGGKPVTIFAWRVCGDRARILLAIIYPYLTSRRKAQIDATSARYFLNCVGEIPQVQGFAIAKLKLDEYVREHRKMAIARDKQHRKEFYERQKASNPAFMEKRRNWTKAWREKQKVVAIA